jgi:hypothetical protein
MTVREIIGKHLKDNGFDGLYSPDGECACEIADLMPCEGCCDRCEPGYRTQCDCGDHDYHISGKREEEKHG